ncbi:MAG TPA: metallophosphoesterase family protein [bacterium]|nr:metallophosphoesterase family protein [bacterium]HNS48838.1 metallophosphoesterase family protein [bacterium]
MDRSLVLLADIHANLEALHAVLRATEAEAADYFCLGDAVGYGANPAECLKLLRDSGVPLVAGNHDRAVRHPGLTSIFTPEARQAVFWTIEHLFPADRDQLDGLPGTVARDGLRFVHAGPLEPETWPYLVEEAELTANLRALAPGEICFFGHTHRPGLYEWRAGRFAARSLEGTVRLDPGASYLVNPGSVGQPRDGDPRAAYLVFDPAARTVRLERVSYDVAAAQEKILRAGLPEALARRLAFGY